MVDKLRIIDEREGRPKQFPGFSSDRVCRRPMMLMKNLKEGDTPAVLPKSAQPVERKRLDRNALAKERGKSA